MAAPVPEVFEHIGPWTEEEFLALPVDRRVELLDGALLVSPNARVRHQRLSLRLWAALDAVVPVGGVRCWGRSTSGWVPARS